MRSNLFLGVALLALIGVSEQAHAQLARQSPPLFVTTDLANNPVTATGAGSSRTLAAISFDELNAATLAAAALPLNKLGVASGAASLNSNGLLPSAQIPFGTTTGTVGDGGILNTTTTTANAAIPSTKIGAASGVASLNSLSQIPSAQLLFGTTTGTVADGGVLNSTTTTANAAIPSSKIGAASGVASLNSSSQIPSAQILFGTTTGTVADGGALASIQTTANGAAQKTNNLSDLASPSAALSNLGGLSLTAGGTVSGATILNNVRVAGGTVLADVTSRTLTAADCGTKIWDPNATAAHTFTAPTGLPIRCTIVFEQETSNPLNLTNAASEVFNYYNSSSGLPVVGSATAGATTVAPLNQFMDITFVQNSATTATLFGGPVL